MRIIHWLVIRLSHWKLYPQADLRSAYAHFNWKSEYQDATPSDIRYCSWFVRVSRPQEQRATNGMGCLGMGSVTALLSGQARASYSLGDAVDYGIIADRTRRACNSVTAPSMEMSPPTIRGRQRAVTTFSSAAARLTETSASSARRRAILVRARSATRNCVGRANHRYGLLQSRPCKL